MGLNNQGSNPIPCTAFLLEPFSRFFGEKISSYKANVLLVRSSRNRSFYLTRQVIALRIDVKSRSRNHINLYNSCSMYYLEGACKWK